MKAKASAEKGEHQNAARAALVIGALAGAKERGMRLTDVIESTGLGTATAHRLLAGLVEHGFVDHDRPNNRYFVGLKMISWAATATERYGLAPFVEQSLDWLSAETEDTVFFSLISGFDSVCVDRREGSYPIKTLTLSVGDHRPLGIGGGSLAMLSFQSDEMLAQILETDEERRLAFGIQTPFLLDEIEKAQAREYAINEGRLISGMSGVGVPIRRADGQAVAALSVAAITSRLEGDRLDKVIGLLKSAAKHVEETASDVLNTPFAKRHNIRKGS